MRNRGWAWRMRFKDPPGALGYRVGVFTTRGDRIMHHLSSLRPVAGRSGPSRGYCGGSEGWRWPTALQLQERDMFVKPGIRVRGLVWENARVTWMNHPRRELTKWDDCVGRT